jgi:hypothetical protein
MTGRQIVLVGSGHLARAVGHSLAALATASPSVGVTILARDGAAAGELALACAARAAVSGSPISFAAGPLAETDAVLERLRPAVLLCCVSEQSPYERVLAPSAWTALVAEGGFGITLPFQAAIAADLARAVSRSSPQTLFVNGAFPDAVNPLLAALGLPVLCGIGNVSTLNACLGAGQPKRLRVLGHHVHLGQAAEEARAWEDDQELADVTERLAGYRGLPRVELNGIAGHAAARLVLDLAAGRAVRTSVPGPLGLPGGYPVTITGGVVELDLPPGLTRTDAVAWNVRAGEADGVSVVDGYVRYTPTAAKVRPDWAVTELDQVRHELAEIRQQLRRTKE